MVALTLLVLFVSFPCVGDWLDVYQNTSRKPVIDLPFDGDAGRAKLQGGQWVKRRTVDYTLDFAGKGAAPMPDPIDDRHEKNRFTVEAWIYPRKHHGGYVLLKKRSFGFPNIRDDGRLVWYLRDGAGHDQGGVAEYTVKLNVWQHLAMTFDGKQVQVFVDGALVQTKPMAIAMEASAHAFLVGGSGGWGNDYDGLIGLLRVHDEVLDAAALRATCDTLKAGRRPRGNPSFETPVWPDRTGMPAGEKSLALDGEGLATVDGVPVVNGYTMGAWVTPVHNDGVVLSFGEDLAISAEKLKPDRRQHVMASWDGKRLRLFIDGKAASSREAVGPASDRLTIGENFRGQIDQIKVFDVPIVQLSDTVGRTVVTRASHDDPSTRRWPRSRHIVGHTARDPLVGFEDLTGWTVETESGISEAALYRSAEEPLWGDYVGKLVFKSGPYQDSYPKLTLRPPSPIPVNQSFNGINLWVFGEYWKAGAKGVKVSVEVEDADGKQHSFALQTREYPWVCWTGWFIFHRTLPVSVAAPAKLLGLTFYDFDGTQSETIYLDNLELYPMDAAPIAGLEVPTWEEIGAPTTPDTILPPLDKGVTFTNRIERHGDTVRLIYDGSDGQFVYVYTPKTGTLSDIAVDYHDRQFQPCVDGGIQLDAKRTLKELSVDGNTVRTTWQWRADDGVFDAQLDFTIKRKSLVVDIAAQPPRACEVTFGRAIGLTDPKLVDVPYLVLRPGLHKSVDPVVVYDNGLLLGGFVDWYNSDASELFGVAEKRDDGSVVYNGGSVYTPLTDGTHNPIRERLFINVSDKLDEVLPSIPNPPNRWLKTTKSKVWVTRSWYVNKLPMPDYFDRRTAFWRRVKAAGIDHLYIRDHASLYRQYVHAIGDPYTFTLSCDPALGGDKKLKQFIDALQNELGFAYGFYTNYTLMSPLSAQVWDENNLARSPTGDWRWGSLSSAMVRNSRILPLQREYSGAIKKKFGAQVSYPDQCTCRPPWSYTDFDPRVPGAGKFAAAYRVLAKQLLQESEIFNGPVLSEGIIQWMFAGFADSYAQPSKADQHVLVDFQLRRLHMLSNDCGFHLEWVADKGNVDRLLASEIAYGHTGHLYNCYGGAPPDPLPGDLLKSYFMIQQLQQYYATTPIETIRYHHEAKLLTTEQAIGADALANNQVYLKYANGLEVYVNRHAKDNWTITLGGERYVLPPNGYAARLNDELLEYSALMDGKRRDYVRGPQYTWIDGELTLHDRVSAQ